MSWITWARVASWSSTKTSRSGPGSQLGWPPRRRPTKNATTALVAAMTGVRKRGFMWSAEGSQAPYGADKAALPNDVMPVRQPLSPQRAAAGMATFGRVSNAQEAPQRQPAAERGDRHARAQQDQDQQPEVDRARRRQQREAVGQRIDERVLPDRQEQHGHRAAEQPDDHPLDHERPTDEPVGRAYQLHHLHLAAAGEDREPDRVRDESDRRQREEDRQSGRDELHEARGRQDLLRVLLAVAYLVDGREARRRQRAGDRVDAVGVARCEAERVRQRVRAEQRERLLVAPLHGLERLLLRDVLDALHVRHGEQLLVQLRLLGVGGVRLDEDVDHNPTADLVRCTRRRLNHWDEHAEHERGDQDREHRGERRRSAAPQRSERLLEEEADPHRGATGRTGGSVPIPSSSRRRAANSTVDSSTAYMPATSSRMTRPSRSSITRRRILSTISRSCVATTTVVPVRLMR